MSISLNYIPARNIHLLGQSSSASLGFVEQFGLFSLIPEIKKYTAITTAIAKIMGFLINLFINIPLGYQPLGSIPKRSNSLRPRVLSQLAKLVFDCLAAISNCSFSSGDIRILNCGDCPSPFGLLSRFTVDKWSPIELALVLIGGHLNTGEPIKSTPPNSITSTERGLTTNDNYTIEVAMKDHIMPINGHNSPISINLFNWRFFSCQQFKYLTVTARTEQEARSMLPDSPCLFSARVPAKAVAHV